MSERSKIAVVPVQRAPCLSGISNIFSPGNFTLDRWKISCIVGRGRSVTLRVERHGVFHSYEYKCNWSAWLVKRKGQTKNEVSTNG